MSQNKPGPEKKYDGKRLTVRLDWKIRAHLEKQADESDKTESELVRQILEHWLVDQGQEPDADPAQNSLFTE